MAADCSDPPAAAGDAARDRRAPAAEEVAAGGRLTIDPGALAANYDLLAARAAPAECAAVVKADAYGLGVGRVVPVLLARGCRSFFVAQIGEAAAVAALLPPDAALYILNGVPPGAEAAVAASGAIPVLNAAGQARRWQRHAEATGAPLPAALQVDSGMSRLGMAVAELAALAADPAFRAAVPVRLLITHLACADHAGAPSNEAQRARFRLACDALPGVPRSIANSGGVLLGAGFHLDLVRVGIGLYGGAPADPAANPMRAVVALDARVIQLRAIGAGTGVGYGLTHVARAPERIATLGVGYADGWPRTLGNVGAAWFGATRLPIVGRVSMDSLSVDVSALPPETLEEGDWVELIGPHQSLDAVAAAAGTLSYEILTDIGARYAVRVIGA